MNKATKIAGKILLICLIVAAACTSVSLIIIYNQLSHYWDNFFGLIALLLYVACVPLLITFLIMLIVGKAKK